MNIVSDKDRELIERDDFAELLLDYLTQLASHIRNAREERIEYPREWMEREIKER